MNVEDCRMIDKSQSKETLATKLTAGVMVKQNAARTVTPHKIIKNKRKFGDSVVKIKMDTVHSHVRQPVDTNLFASVTQRTKYVYPNHSVHRMSRATLFGGIIHVVMSVNMNRQRADMAAQNGVRMRSQAWK
jgi:hypothetical protein